MLYGMEFGGEDGADREGGSWLQRCIYEVEDSLAIVLESMSGKFTHIIGLQGLLNSEDAGEGGVGVEGGAQAEAADGGRACMRDFTVLLSSVSQLMQAGLGRGAGGVVERVALEIAATVLPVVPVPWFDAQGLASAYMFTCALSESLALRCGVDGGMRAGRGRDSKRNSVRDSVRDSAARLSSRSRLWDAQGGGDGRERGDGGEGGEDAKLVAALGEFLAEVVLFMDARSCGEGEEEGGGEGGIRRGGAATGVGKGFVQGQGRRGGQGVTGGKQDLGRRETAEAIVGEMEEIEIEEIGGKETALILNAIAKTRSPQACTPNTLNLKLNPKP